MTQKTNSQDITKEISDLESRLQDAKARLAAANGPNGKHDPWPHKQNGVTTPKKINAWVLI